MVTVVGGGWGDVSTDAVQAVLDSVFGVVTESFGRSPGAPIRVERWEKNPRTLYDHRPYEIKINAGDTYWCQYVYEFAHELCYVMTNFDWVKEHRYKWFEEALCELCSLFVLNRLASTWRTEPPCAVWHAAGFAGEFKIYADGVMQGRSGARPEDFASWFRQQTGTLEQDRYRRTLNGVVADALLPDFLADSSVWQECGRLNHWDAGTNPSFGSYLDAWSGVLRRDALPGKVPRLVGGFLRASNA